MCGEGKEQGGGAGQEGGRGAAAQMLRGERVEDHFASRHGCCFSSPRALPVCAQELCKDPAQSCTNFEVHQSSVRKFGGRTGSGFSRWNSGSRRWNEPLLKKSPPTVGEVLFLSGLVPLSR